MDDLIIIICHHYKNLKYMWNCQMSRPYLANCLFWSDCYVFELLLFKWKTLSRMSELSDFSKSLVHGCCLAVVNNDVFPWFIDPISCLSLMNTEVITTCKWLFHDQWASCYTEQCLYSPQHTWAWKWWLSLKQCASMNRLFGSKKVPS